MRFCLYRYSIACICSITTLGASSGIGAATAVEFAKHHACLVLCGRNEARLKEVDEKCKAAGASKARYSIPFKNVVSNLHRKD